MLSRTDLKPADAIRVELPRAPLEAPDDAVQLAQTLRDNEEHLQGAVEAAGMGIWEFDVPTGATTWWPGMERLHGMPAGSSTPDRAAYQSVIHPDDRDRFNEALERSIAGTGWHRLEYRVVWPDGTLHWLEARGRVKRDASGRPVTMAGVCQDITRRKHNELDLEFLAQASAELAGVADYQTTLDRIARLAVPQFADWCAIDLLLPDGRLHRVAAAHVDPSKVHLAHDLHRRYPPDPESPVGTWSVLRSGKGILVPVITEDVLEARASAPEPLDMLKQLGLRSYIGAPLNARGRTMGVLTFVTAESGRRYESEDLALAEDLARRAAVAIENAQLLLAMKESDRAKDVFLATLAHELRNPLAPIWNGLSIIKKSRGDAARIEQVGGIMERQVGQLARLVDDLLDVSRITTGKIELKKERTNLVHIINAAVEISRPHIEAAHHKLSISYPDAPTHLVADAARLAQVFSNLLNNAAKYTRRGGRIEVVIESQPHELVVRIRDNGTGIEPDMLGKVFGLFTQVTHPTERRQGGLGIGLSLVDGLVRLHGGRVEAHSPGLDKGSEFTVHLPRSDEAGGGGPSPSARTAAEPTPPPPTTAARRILVVDDNEDAANTVAELLQMAGNEVAVASDGLGAVEKTREFRPDVVLLDIGLPDFNGYEAARRIRKLEGVRQPILIALTGWGQQQDKQLAAEAGFDHHWTKPVDPARLLELSGR